MSASNIGISQLEALQLRNLLGPTGIGSYTYNNTGIIAFILNPAGDTYTSPYSLPSGTGMCKVRIGFDLLPVAGTTAIVTFLTFNVGSFTSLLNVPSGLPAGTTTYEGTFMYNNPTPSPAYITVDIGFQNAAISTLKYFEANYISFGPYVDQGQ